MFLYDCFCFNYNYNVMLFVLMVFKGIISVSTGYLADVSDGRKVHQTKASKHASWGSLSP